MRLTEKEQKLEIENEKLVEVNFFFSFFFPLFSIINFF